LHVVNFGLQHLGRDIEYLIAREAIDTRHVRLLVVEVSDEESRSLHPVFFELASPWELIDAPIVINPQYLDNLSRLPLRQVSLFLRSIIPDWFGTDPNFDPVTYRGSNWDDTYEERGTVAYPITNAAPRLKVQTIAQLAAEKVHYAKMQEDKLHLPEFLRGLEYRANLVYLRRIVELAQRHGVAVRFLYLPGYDAPEPPQLAAYYARIGNVWYPQMVYGEINNWLDVNHLNFQGAGALSHWLGIRIADEQGSGTALAATRHP
jgi:hypothetical protein